MSISTRSPLKVAIIPTFRAGDQEPFESGNNTHFQRHSCPGADFWSEKVKKGIFIRNFPLETAFLPFSAILPFFHVLNYKLSCIGISTHFNIIS
jgi:hypothetical protein